jgi:uncharacterized protein YdcH (DUF465 family)
LEVLSRGLAIHANQVLHRKGLIMPPHYDDFIINLKKKNPSRFKRLVSKMTPARKRIAREIIARYELSEEEFQELIDNPRYYKEEYF